MNPQVKQEGSNPKPQEIQGTIPLLYEKRIKDLTLGVTTITLEP